MPLNIAVIYGSVREGRLGTRVAKFIVNKLKERKHEAVLIDPVEHRLPLLEKPHKYYEPGTAPEVMETLAKILTKADGFIIVSGEYNHGIPPALKNLLDHFYTKEFGFKPSAIACYSIGPFGGVRAAMQLRAVLPELKMPSIPTLFPVQKVHESFDENGNPLDDSYNEKADKFLDEFEWYANAMKEARKKGTPY